MITFITGLPGAGKTLLTIQLVRQYEIDENKDKREAGETEGLRQVYYSGIGGLKLDWQEMDSPEQWHKLPTGSIIVIDESQKIFPNLSNGAKRPTHYTEFQTHRHSGYDIFLITQDATLVDNTVRALANRHIHQSRSFGLESATQYEWQAVNSTKPYALKMDTDAVKRQWKFPKDVYDLYKSAEQHTHKKRLPYKKIIPIVLVGVVGLGIIIYMLIWISTPRDLTTDEPLEETTNTTEIIPQTSPRQTLFTDLERFVPTVPNLPMSAPAYEHLVQVRDFPKIKGCLLFEINNVVVECNCHDQQSNLIPIETLACMNWLQNGSFDFTLANAGNTRNRQQRNPTKSLLNTQP